MDEKKILKNKEDLQHESPGEEEDERKTNGQQKNPPITLWEEELYKILDGEYNHTITKMACGISTGSAFHLIWFIQQGFSYFWIKFMFDNDIKIYLELYG